MHKYDKANIKYVKFLNDDQQECYFNLETKERMDKLPHFENIYKLIEADRAKKTKKYR